MGRVKFENLPRLMDDLSSYKVKKARKQRKTVLQPEYEGIPDNPGMFQVFACQGARYVC